MEAVVVAVVLALVFLYLFICGGKFEDKNKDQN
jgi:hypothetical protein